MKPTALREYKRKRNFSRTSEPRGGRSTTRAGFSFVIQKHAARRLHYDFRLELDGVLLSWAVPKGPSLDPKVKRMAVQTEDHPIEYGTFEGTIPKGEYGGGTVAVWDRGTWSPEGDAREAYRRGRLTFALHGEKLRGGWHLIRTHGRGDGGGKTKSWLLFKASDAEARAGSGSQVVDENPASVTSGRSLEQIAADPDRVWHSDRSTEPEPPKTGKARKAAGERARARQPRAAAKGRAAALPDFIPPQLATLVGDAPDGDDWLHEIKLDGYRLLARLDHGEVALLTRRGNDWTSRLPALARSIVALPIEQALLDGELVVFGENGVTSFQALQNSLSAGGAAACVYSAFDLLHLNGRDLRGLALTDRKQILLETLRALGALEGRIRFSDHVAGDGPAFFGSACGLGVEGIVSKRASAAYTSGRGRSWLKVKCIKRQEFVIGGFTDPSGARGHFGALLLGQHDEHGKLRYAGKVGTGFSAQSLAELHDRLAPLERERSPFEPPPAGLRKRGVHWLQPELVAEIAFAERTSDGMLRHASFQGLREDKPAAEVTPERPAPKPRATSSRPEAAPAPKSQRRGATTLQPAIARVRLTHPDRVLYPGPGITKAALALYYAQVAPYMLPHVTGRPLSLVRCPDGVTKPCFFQKHPTQGVPPSVHRVRIREKNQTLESLMVDDVDGLVGLIQVGALEIHTWGSRAAQVERPDQLVFDLDPAEDLPWQRSIDAAERLRSLLTELDLAAFLKTTGGKGLHIVVPIEPKLTWDDAKAFSRAVVEQLVRAEPSRYLATMSKARRTGKVFLDYLRNGRGATAVAAYSTRAKPDAPVSLPIAWDELTPALRADSFRLGDVPGRLAALTRDPWASFDADRRPITPAMRRALRLR